MVRAAGVLALALSGCGAAPAPATPSGSPGAVGSGLDGTVLVDRGCPTVPVGTTCPTTPLAGAVVTVTAVGATPGSTSASSATTATTGSDGVFHVALAPGRYQVATRGPTGMPTPATTVVVAPGRVAEVTLVVDSGVRVPVR